MNALPFFATGGALALLASHSFVSQAAPAQTFALRDAHGLIAPDVKTEASAISVALVAPYPCSGAAQNAGAVAPISAIAAAQPQTPLPE